MNGSFSEENCIIGTILKGRYKIISKIGRGSFSVLYETLDLKHNQKRAIKTVCKRLIDTDVYNQMKTEVNILEDRHVPNIVRFYKHFKDNNSFYIVLELCQDGCLKGCLNELKNNNQKLDLTNILEWSRQLLFGIKYIHSQRIIHRDIKPANILRNQNVLKIADFGLSSELSETLSKRSTRCGTFYYMAPELLKFDNTILKYGTEIDIWSLGCVFYEMCELKKPFGHNTDNLAEIRMSIIEGEIPVLNNELQPILQRMFERDPNLRSSAMDLFKDLKEIISNHSNRFLSS